LKVADLCFRKEEKDRQSGISGAPSESPFEWIFERSEDGSQAILQSALERFGNQINDEGFVPSKFHDRNVEFEPQLGDSRIYTNTISIKQYRASKRQISDYKLSHEAYSVQVLEDGQAIIKTLSPQGGIYALDSLLQLFYLHSKISKDLYTSYAPVHIRDSPKFSHRGINLDLSRNRISPRDVMRVLDGMSINKLNHLHLHATDSQSWPLEIPALPELAQKGAYDESQIWSSKDLKDVQEYGLMRAVSVYLEIDLPGHTASIFHAFPDLITAYNQQPWEPYALEPPSGQLKLNSPEVRPFITTLLNDLLPRISPYSSCFHVGCDELNMKSYLLEPGVQSDSREVIRPFLQSFFDHVFSITNAHNLTPLAWEEILLDWDLTLPKSAIIQVWRSHKSLPAVVAKGYRALFGAHTHWYLDCGFGGWLDADPSNPNSRIQPPYLDWCSPYKNWRLIYSYDPLADVPEEHQHLVLGGEVHLWGELTDSTTLDFMLWPRAAAAAEILWKGKMTVEEDVTRRFAEMRERLVLKGIASGVVQMEWSLRNPGGSKA
jgi:hexosaminidase